ncbi:unnamed protein product [Litomosoides sigmodontis]|uniref:Uncharacterized protein n=1 Tax=Litomosoides sigmodontis TaxID=42156 RepID=A0A3P6U3Q2_LITSI|nr:unnamed protein product [Litomosoides sigmodontis]
MMMDSEETGDGRSCWRCTGKGAEGVLGGEQAKPDQNIHVQLLHAEKRDEQKCALHIPLHLTHPPSTGRLHYPFLHDR